MAITKTIEIDVNTLQAVGGLDNLDKALKKVDNSVKSVDASFEEVYGDLKPLTARMGEAEDRLYELALAGQSASQEYKDLLASVGNYRKVQMQTDMVVDAAATTFDTKLGGALQGAVGAFAGVQGAMALTGNQSEELEQAILKVQGAMALSEGVRGVREGMVAFKALGTSAKAALAGIRTGIAATGIGLLVIALGTIVAYWDDIKGAVSGVSSEQEKLNGLAQTNLDTEKNKLDSFSLQENSLKLQGKSEKEILKLKLAQTDQVIKASEIQIEQSIATTKAQTEAAKRNQEILAGVLKFLSLPLTMILKTVDLVGKALGKDFGLEEKVFTGLASFVFDPKETEAEGQKVVDEQKKALEKLKSDRDGLQLSIKNIDNQAAKDAAAKTKENNDKEIQAAKDKADALERIRQGEIDTEAERRAEELRQIQKQYADLIAEAEKYYGENSAKVLSLKEAQRTKENELQAKFDAEDKEKADKKKQEEEDYWNTEAEKAIALADLKKKKANEEKQKEEDLLNAKIGFAEQGLSLITEVAGKGSKIGKAAAIAQTVISGIQGVQNAYTTAQKSPITAIFPGYPIVQAGIAGVFSALQVAKMKSASASSGSSVPSVSAPSVSAPAPTFNVVGNSGVNQIAQTLGSQQPVQAYVVANNVTTQQSLDRNIVNNASLG
jgi:hypothetical protein